MPGIIEGSTCNRARNMVVCKAKTTEYLKAFKPKFPQHLSTYVNNVDYRITRRQAEHSHRQDVFVWEEWEFETDSDSNGNGMVSPARHVGVPQHVYKHQKFIQAYEKSKSHPPITVELKDKAVDCEPPTSPVVSLLKTHDVHVQTSPRKKTVDCGTCTGKVGKSDDQIRRQHSSSEELPKREVCIRAKDPTRKPKRPTGYSVSYKKKFVPKPRPFSAPLARPLKPSALDDKPPFLAYGYKDNERETGAFKTHNVRCSNDVYCSALRAEKRRQAEIEEHDRVRASSASVAERRRVKPTDRNQFLDKVRRETSQWSTEYRNHYLDYEPLAYKRGNPGRITPAHPTATVRG